MAARKKIVLKWTIIAGGVASGASVNQTEFKNEEFHKCMVAKMLTLKFPEPPVDQEAEVKYPFVFAGQ